ncbi:hypothetical protein PRO82_000345 [Candidatus Protochlamydia amoebophila]|nr:hypothetical protein [Candidatus Protochlamydia amoebophila]
MPPKSANISLRRASQWKLINFNEILSFILRQINLGF